MIQQIKQLSSMNTGSGIVLKIAIKCLCIYLAYQKIAISFFPQKYIILSLTLEKNAFPPHDLQFSGVFLLAWSTLHRNFVWIW